MSTPSKTPVTDAAKFDELDSMGTTTGEKVVYAVIAEGLEIDRDKLRQQIDLLLHVRERDKAKVESDSIAASCECNVKTNDPQHHAKGCKYRLICERDTAREKIDAISKRAEAIRCLLVVSEKQRGEKDAQIVALRESLQYLYDATSCTDLQYKTINEALSTPPPAVVPLEDVRPLVVAIKQCTQFTIHPSMSEQNLISATKQFTAKHPL